MTGECDNKDSVWEMLQKEVLYNITWKVINHFYFIEHTVTVLGI